MALDTNPYKGVRDFYPDEMFFQDFLFAIWHDVMQSYGYEHYSASILEPSEIYEGKTSDEIVTEQTYNFTDRGERRITLRPEMTPTVARMIAGKSRELVFPIRWYSIPNVFRYERPQKGRLREHFQLNGDIFGIEKIDAEAELIEISYKIMERLGLNESDFVVKINDRNILDKIIKDIGLDKDKKKEFIRLLDKRDKIDDFNDQMFKLIGRNFDMVIEPNSLIKDLTEKLNSRGIRNVVFDPMMVRGFDYYTGIVFEIFDTDPDNRRSILGGGRYDNLLEIFGAEKKPTVGFGMGDVAIKESLKSRGLIPKRKSMAHIYIANINENSFDYSIKLANDFRQKGLDIIVDYSVKKIGDQIKIADKKNVPFVIVIGENEIKTDELEIKVLETGDSVKLNRDQIIEFVKNIVKG